jgi:hypothetical protein
VVKLWNASAGDSGLYSGLVCFYSRVKNILSSKFKSNGPRIGATHRLELKCAAVFHYYGLKEPGTLRLAFLSQTSEDYSMFPVTILYFSFVIWACWRLYFRRRFLRTCWMSYVVLLEDQCFSWWNYFITWLNLGSLDRLSDWEFHHIAETCKREILLNNFLIISSTYHCNQMGPWYESRDSLGYFYSFTDRSSIWFKLVQANNLMYMTRGLYIISW